MIKSIIRKIVFDAINFSNLVVISWGCLYQWHWYYFLFLCYLYL